MSFKRRLKKYIPSKFLPIFSPLTYFVYRRGTKGASKSLSAGFEVVYLTTKAEFMTLQEQNYKLDAINILSEFDRLLENGTCILLIFCDRKFAHYTCIASQQQNAILDSLFSSLAELDGQGGVIGPCLTSPDYRGKGLYPQALELACSYLANQNRVVAFINTKSSNIPSQKGIEKAGFTLVKKVSLLTILGSRLFLWTRSLNQIAK